MRILLIAGAYPPIKCGVGDYTAELARALARRDDVVVSVMTDVAARASSELDAAVELQAVIDGWRFSEFPAIIDRIVSWRADIVHMQFGSSRYRRKLLPWFMPAALRYHSLRVVQTWHEWPEDVARFFRNLPNALTPGGLVVVKEEIERSMSNWNRRLIRNKHFRFIPNASVIPRVPLTDTTRAVVRRSIAPSATNFVAFFGFANARKGVETLFEILDPNASFLVLMCDLDARDNYHRRLLDTINSDRWRGRVAVTGFLPPLDAGRLLAAVDAVALPFPGGGGTWSTSAHAAIAQGTFLLATSHSRHGYNPEENAYYARPGDIADMRSALRTYMGYRIDPGNTQSRQWTNIADAHVALYREILVHSPGDAQGRRCPA